MNTESQQSTFGADKLIELKRVERVVPSPCGTWAAIVVGRLNKMKNRFTNDIWKISLLGNEPPELLVLSDSNDFSPGFRQDGSLAFLSNRSENSEDKGLAKQQVWILDAADGSLKSVTNEPLGVNAFKFAADGNRLVAFSNLLTDIPFEEQSREMEKRQQESSALHYTNLPVRNFNHWLPKEVSHLISFDDKGNNRVDLTPNADFEYRFSEFDVSPNGRKIAITRTDFEEDGVLRQELLLFDNDANSFRSLEKAPFTNIEFPQFCPESKNIVCKRHRRDRGGYGKCDLLVVDIETGEQRPIDKNWDQTLRPWCWTADGESVIVTSDDHGYVPIHRISRDGLPERITDFQIGGTHSSISRVDGTDDLIGIRSTFLTPPEPFVIRQRKNSTPKFLCHLSGFKKEDIQDKVTVESIEIESTDSRKIHSFFIKPKKTGGQIGATVLHIHGGPIYSWTDNWNWNLNPLILVADGYSVALPNPRGSTGYGLEYIEENWGNVWGELCYRDLMAVMDCIEKRDDVDADRTSAMGCSFGGYMTNWIGANTTRFRCLISQAGISSIPNHCSSMDFSGYWRWILKLDRYQYDIEDIDRYSPCKKLKDWETPVLIVHGEKDYRSPVSEALTLFEGLQFHGVESELLIFPDESHGFSKPKNVVAWYDNIIRFLGKHLEE